MPHWLEVVSHLHPKYGGLSAAVPALGAAVAAASGNAVTLAAFCAERERIVPAEAGSIGVQYLPLGRRQFAQDTSAEVRLRSLIADAAAVHIHGLWQHSTVHAARLARELRRPYVVSAHGMLDRWALDQKRWKKAVYAALVERPLLRRAACLHALTEAEADDYRRFGLRGPVAVIPNGVTVRADVDTELFLNHFPFLRGQRLFLFLGRLHVKKGVHVLCEAWSDLEARWPDAHLVIAGPDFENTRASVEARCAVLGCKRVTLAGMLEGDVKWSALRASHAFLLPSYSEGLSVSVLEAMGMGLPVIVTRQCNLPEVRMRDCGWEIEPDRDELRSAIEECLQAPASRLSAMGVNGRELVESRYSWSRVGSQMATVYGWLAGGSKPTGVFAGERDESVWGTARKGASA
jgi:glycosyltransferase involved in cell wall biosynthesis